jgi:hypothetical protein
LRPSQRVYRPPERFALNAASPQANGLIGWFPFAGQRRGDLQAHNEVLGTAYTTVHSNPEWVVDADLGGVANFTGYTRYNPGLAGIIGDRFTVAAVLKRTTTSSDLWFWGTGDQRSNNNQLHIGSTSSTTLNFNFWNNDLQVTVDSLVGGWAWVVATYDKSLGTGNQKLFLNGVQIGQRNNTTGFTGHQIHYLGYREYNSQSWTGYIADVRIYNRALSADEVWQLYDPATRWELYQPERKLWQGISSTPSATIELTGIPSAEAVGRPAIDDGLKRIFPTGIPTAEAVGTPTVLLPTRRVTQTLAEVDGDWQPAVRVSQMLVEVDVAERIPIRITQALAEVDLLPPLELQGQAAGTSSAIGALDWFVQVAGDDGRAGRPEVRVEISRGRAPMESPDWEDVSAYLRETITIDRGRQKELGLVQCGTAQLTLDNRERRFEPGVTGRMPMQRIRISARLSEDDLPLPQRQFGAEGDIGGGWWALFSGYVESWEPEAFVDGSRDALVHVRCIDGFEPLARVMLNESFEQQLTGERIDAVLTACGWTVGEAWVVGSETNGVVGSMVLGPVNDRLLADGTSEVQAQELEQVPALQHIQQVADAEGGWFFISKLGLATFYDRHRLLSEAGRAPRCIWGTYRLGTETAPVYPYSGLLYSLGCEWIYNEVRLQAIDGEEQVQSDTDSIRHYFRRTLIKTDLPLARDVDVEAMARFLLNRYREPVLRFDELSWEGAIPATACEALLALDMGDLVQVRQVHPAGGAIVAQDSVIQGVQYRIDESRWRVTMQLSPLGGPVSGYWIVGSSRLGIETVPAW